MYNPACLLGAWLSPVRALRSGRRGPRFKSGRPDRFDLTRQDKTPKLGGLLFQTRPPREINIYSPKRRMNQVFTTWVRMT